MPKNVVIDIPTLPDGAEVEVPGLGVFHNGRTEEVSDERLEQYRLAGYSEPEGNFEFRYEAPKEGPTEKFEDTIRYDEAIKNSDEAMLEQLEIQKEREEDPLATAHVGIEVDGPVEEEDK